MNECCLKSEWYNKWACQVNIAPLVGFSIRTSDALFPDAQTRRLFEERVGAEPVLALNTLIQKMNEMVLAEQVDWKAYRSLYQQVSEILLEPDQLAEVSSQISTIGDNIFDLVHQLCRDLRYMIPLSDDKIREADIWKLAQKDPQNYPHIVTFTFLVLHGDLVPRADLTYQELKDTIDDRELNIKFVKHSVEAMVRLEEGELAIARDLLHKIGFAIRPGYSIKPSTPEEMASVIPEADSAGGTALPY